MIREQKYCLGFEESDVHSCLSDGEEEDFPENPFCEDTYIKCRLDIVNIMHAPKHILNRFRFLTWDKLGHQLLRHQEMDRCFFLVTWRAPKNVCVCVA